MSDQGAINPVSDLDSRYSADSDSEAEDDFETARNFLLFALAGKLIGGTDFLLLMMALEADRAAELEESDDEETDDEESNEEDEDEEDSPEPLVDSDGPLL